MRGRLDLSRVRVLIVDDNKYMRNMLRGILNAFGVRLVREASDGADALKELRVFPADLALVDNYMVPIGGIDFIKLLRTSRDSPDPFLPVIMISGHTDKHWIEAARDAGADEFLAKPVSAQSLFARVHITLTQPRPFVSGGHYAGPDRRRRATEWRYAERRKKGVELVPRKLPCITE